MGTPARPKQHILLWIPRRMSIANECCLPPPHLPACLTRRLNCKANSSHCFRAELKPLAWANLLSASKLDNKRTAPSGPSSRRGVESREHRADSRQQSVTPTNHAQYIGTTRKKQNEPPKWQKMTRILQPVNYGRSGTTDWGGQNRTKRVCLGWAEGH